MLSTVFSASFNSPLIITILKCQNGTHFVGEETEAWRGKELAKRPE
jgi:hypothetical protein